MKIKHRLCSFVLSFVMLPCLLFPVRAQADPVLPAVAQGCATLDGQVSLYAQERLLDTAKGVILYERDTDTLVYSWAPDERLDPSGMNKIMTAMLAIEAGDLDAVVTVTREALSSVSIGSVSAGLKAGEQLSLRDLMYCMMVGSANDAAAVIAEHLGGSQEGFVRMMDEKLEQLGCHDTKFLNANGLSCEGQYTTARDLAKITLAALDDPFFVELFGAVSYTVPATEVSEERQLLTTNYLMSDASNRSYLDQRVTGGKTGALSTTDRSLITTAEVDGVRYLAVVMSAQGTVTANGLAVKTFGSFEETKTLLDHAFDDNSAWQLLHQQQVMAQLQVSGGENDVIGRPAADLVVTLPNDASMEDVSYRCVPSDGGLQAPIQKDQTIGTVEVWFRDICVGQCDMVAMYGVAEPGVDNISLVPTAEATAKRTWITWLLVGGILLLVGLLVTFAVLFGMRRARLEKIRKRHQLIDGHGTKGRR